MPAWFSGQKKSDTPPASTPAHAATTSTAPARAETTDASEPARTDVTNKTNDKSSKANGSNVSSPSGAVARGLESPPADLLDATDIHAMALEAAEAKFEELKRKRMRDLDSSLRQMELTRRQEMKARISEEENELRKPLQEKMRLEVQLKHEHFNFEIILQGRLVKLYSFFIHFFL